MMMTMMMLIICRSNRFMYILRKELTVFGSKNDIQLMSLAVIKNHCTAKYDAAGSAVSVSLHLYST